MYPARDPDTATFGSTNDFYRIRLQTYSRQLHSDLPATNLRGYVQVDANGTPTRPVRVLFQNSIGIQVNVMIPRALAGKGEVDLALMVGGKAANTVRVYIK